ncbi:MAG: CoA ester lyase [Pseudomonadaceae bacterium]|nr:CoA ester lyase [Pseudomonadaceae bacterium]
MLANPRRSFHFVPGGQQKMFAKALASNADALILDLEDAVSVDRKASARREVAAWLGDTDFGGKLSIVRINPLNTPWGRADVETVIEASPQAILLPKVSCIADVNAAARLITRHEQGNGIAEGDVELLLVATETPEAVLNIQSLTTCPRVTGMTWGAEDLSAAIGAPRSRTDSGEYLPVFELARQQTLLACAAAAIQPIDTVWVDIKDTAGLAGECQRARWTGFTGKVTIHPNQIDIVNDAFTPSESELEYATALLAKAEAAASEGRGAFAFRGDMIDAPHITRARATLARANITGTTP